MNTMGFGHRVAAAEGSGRKLTHWAGNRPEATTAPPSGIRRPDSTHCTCDGDYSYAADLRRCQINLRRCQTSPVSKPAPVSDHHFGRDADPLRRGGCRLSFLCDSTCHKAHIPRRPRIRRPVASGARAPNPVRPDRVRGWLRKPGPYDDRRVSAIPSSSRRLRPAGASSAQLAGGPRPASVRRSASPGRRSFDRRPQNPPDRHRLQSLRRAPAGDGPASRVRALVWRSSG